MSYTKIHQRCLITNRWLIYIFSLVGLFTGSNIAYFIALTLWVWLDCVIRFEIEQCKKLSHWEKHHKLDLTSIFITRLKN
ncbi:MAG: hypothetical protein HQL46_05640 [Gammaproteobacteria bacterium]|nr:hypothetical protein [Gammaproteobacteria bacterium]